MHVVIVAAQEFAARLHARVPLHRGRLHSSEHRDGVQTISARVPQAEVSTFVAAVLTDTNGLARMSMALYEHWPVADRPPGGDQAAGVREPRPKAPFVPSGAIAVPEPNTTDDSQ